MKKGLVSANSLPALTGDSLDSYLTAIAGIPVLTAEEEFKLATEHFKTKSLTAARKLVMSNLKFVAHIARSYSGYGLSQMDLIQEGNIGLMKAVKKFDPYKKVRLISFAVHWIRAEIHEFVVRNWRIVKIATTKEQRKLFFNLRKNRKSLGWLNQEEVQNIAKELKVKPQTVVEMDKRLGMPELGFDLPDSVHVDNFTPSQYLKADKANPEDLVEVEDTLDFKNTRIKQALMLLDSRSADIVKSRWLNEPKTTLTDLARKYAVSAERIRQLEKAAFIKMKDALAETIDF